MGLDNVGHYVPASTDAPARSAFDKFSRSLRDPFPVATTTARTALLAALAAASPAVVPSTSSPIFFHQADLPKGYRTVYTVDGSNFIALSGAFVWANTAARTAATTMAAGDTGYQVDTKVTYRYSGSAWRAIFAHVDAGLVTPTSVAGATLTDRKIIAAASSAIIINGAFDPDHDRYTVAYDLVTSANVVLDAVFRLAGVNATTGYDYTRLRGIAATASSFQSLNGAAFALLGTTGAGARHIGTIEVFSPAAATQTLATITTLTTENPMNTANGITVFGVQHRTATAYDGLSITPGSGTVTGWLTITAHDH